MSTNELQPDVEEVLQVEPDGYEPTVKVSQQGPVRVQDLPRKAGSTKRVTVQALPTPWRLLRPNPRRASAIVVADAAILIAFNTAAAQDSTTMAEWPPLEPLTITHTSDVWVAAVTGTAEVSVLVEYWATGEGED